MLFHRSLNALPVLEKIKDSLQKIRVPVECLSKSEGLYRNIVAFKHFHGNIENSKGYENSVEV